MIGKLIETIDLSYTYIAVSTDHTRAIGVQDHSGDPVPLLISGPDVPASDVTKFSERTVTHRNLWRLRGFDLTPVLMNCIGKASKFGY